MAISESTRQAYYQVDVFLNLISEEFTSKIPQKLKDYLKEEKSKNFEFFIDPMKPILEQNLSDEAIAIIAFINLKYWATEEEKRELMKYYDNNEKKKKEAEEKRQEELRKKYNPDTVFDNKYTQKYNENNSEKIEITENKEEITALVEKKENIITRFINFIKNIFKSDSK